MRFNPKKESVIRKLILLLTLFLAAASDAQTTNAPRTYFDAFNTRPDTLLIKGSSTVGTLVSQISYPVEIRAERLTSPQTTNSVYAVSLRTRVQGQTQLDYVDYDELDALIQALQFISQANSTMTPLDNFAAVFRTRSGLSIAKVGKVDKTVISMTSGDVNGARNEMAPFVLDEMARCVVAAKAKIDAVAAGGR
jgi:hypothetical protein